MTFELFSLLEEHSEVQELSSILLSLPLPEVRRGCSRWNNLALNIDGIAYLVDWLLHSANPENLQTALEMIDAMGITVTKQNLS